jgi:serine/threonine protein kinase
MRKFPIIQGKDYRAPEVVDEKGNYTQKADMWTVGVLIFYMLFGVLPSRLISNTENVYSKLGECLESRDPLKFFGSLGTSKTPTFLKATRDKEILLGEVYPKVVNLMLRCLVMDPDRRISSHEALVVGHSLGGAYGLGFSFNDNFLNFSTRSYAGSPKIYGRIELLSEKHASKLTKILVLDLFERLVDLYDMNEGFEEWEVKTILAVCYLLAAKLNEGRKFPEPRLDGVVKYFELEVSPETLLSLEVYIVEDLHFILYPNSLAILRS